MVKPKSVKGWLKMLLAIADSAAFELSGIDKLSEDEKLVINTLTAEIQNQLGEEFYTILEKYNLVWKG